MLFSSKPPTPRETEIAQLITRVFADGLAKALMAAVDSVDGLSLDSKIAISEAILAKLTAPNWLESFLRAPDAPPE